jgi:hypothetical protein
MNGAVNSPAALDPLLQVRLEMMRAYDVEYRSRPEYSDYEKFVFAANPAGDLVTSIFASPMKGMREWLDERPEEQMDADYFQTAVRKFADGITIDLDDVKPDSGNPAKLALYQELAYQFGASLPLLWPGLVVEAINNGLTKKWKPDGQFIWDIHEMNYRDTSVGQFRNYYSKTSQGGSAAMPLTYGNLIAKIKAGYAFKLPNGKDYPIRYTYLVVPPSLYPTALRLCTFERLPAYEAVSGASSSAGGDVLNEVKQYGVMPLMLAGMGSLEWMLSDASSPMTRGIGLKKRQDITPQQIGPESLSAIGSGDNDSGVISQEAYKHNRTKYGAKARGEAYFRNWWGQVLCDGTP